MFPQFRLAPKAKRDRDQNVVQSLRDRENLHKILERKDELALRGEKLAHQKLFEAEAEVEARHWEKRNSEMALYEVNQEFEFERFQLQASRWAYQAQRDNFSLYGELELTNRPFQENPARNYQEIEEL